MQTGELVFCTSDDGDRLLLLAREVDAFVRHLPNAVSGGETTA